MGEVKWGQGKELAPLFACKDPQVGKLGVSERTTENKQDSVVRAEFKI